MYYGDNVDSLTEILKKYYGENARFKKGQKEAVESVLEGNRTLVVQKTGWGKSLIYFMATKILRSRGKGITLIISPLLVLMKDQIDSAEKFKLNVRTVNSDNEGEWDEIYEELNANKIDALIISPERLSNEDFKKRLGGIVNKIGLFVVDEAHCISDWGHDFRPDYQRIKDIINNMPSNIPVLATTATANNRVIEDIREQLGKDLVVSRGSLMRESLAIQVIKLPTKEDRLAWLAENVIKMPGSGIIYCLTHNDCDLVAGWLKHRGISAEAVYSGIDDKDQIMECFKRNEIKAIAATTAVGMGYDKPDVGFVIHFQKPGNLIGYYQQIGRAGRNLDIAYAILLCGEEDDAINEYFIKSAFPTEDMMNEIVRALEIHTNGMGKGEFVHYVNMKQTAIEKCLKYLEVQGDIYKDGRLYYKTPRPWAPDMQKSKEITRMREDEMKQVDEFANLDSSICYMSFIAKALDDDTAANCGKCAHCKGNPLFPESADNDLIIEAGQYIKHSHYAIKPRKKWPTGIKVEDSSNIPSKYLCQTGLVLSNYADAGWGKMVRDGKYKRNPPTFGDELVRASVEVLSDFIKENDIAWVTNIPSRRRPELVRNFAIKLADALNLEYSEAIEKTKDVPEQKTWENSLRQYENAENSFDVAEERVREENLLLIDDMVDSGWTFTVCGYKLTKAGSGKVFPYALANTGNREGRI